MNINMSVLLQGHRAVNNQQMPKERQINEHHWQKTFNQALAQNSACASIAPVSRAGQEATEAGFVLSLQKNTMPNLSATNQQQAQEQMRTSSGLNQKIPNSNLLGQGQVSNIPATQMAPMLGQIPFVQNTSQGQGVQQKVGYQSSVVSNPLIAYSTMADTEFKQMNVFLSIDQDQAKLWLRDSKISKTQTNEILAKINQSLRQQHITLASVVVNGVTQFS